METIMDSVKAYWHACDNFGDALTPYLIKNISGQNAQWVEANSDPSLVMVTGSILGCNTTSGIVWGTGCAFEADIDPSCFAAPSDNFRILATRGLLSKNIVEQSGHKPIAFGDPGLLLPRFYKPNMRRQYEIGIMCSWVDYDEVSLNYLNKNITIINSMGEVQHIISRMLECEIIITSTLHGLVAAIAYGLPTVSVKFSDKMIGDGFKYKDFLTCTDQQYDQIDLRDKVPTIEDLKKLAFKHKITADINQLLDCCPFKQEGGSVDSGL
jgi:pyruvyltransferase